MIRRPIPGFPGYEADEQGHVWSRLRWNAATPRQMRPVLTWGGYLRLDVMVDGRRVHRQLHVLVCTAFCGPKPSTAHQVRHLDGDPQNNVPSNLVWGTSRENAADREAHGRTARGERAGTAVLTPDQVTVIRRLHEQGVSQENLATLCRVRQSTIGRIVRGRTWA